MLTVPPGPFRKSRRRQKYKVTTAPAAPINMITSVIVSEDQQTMTVLFTEGTVVTAVGAPDSKFLVNYPDGVTSSNFAEIVSPTQVRLVLWDQIDPPATWEVADVTLFTFETGVFAGPTTGDVIFPE
jgi:hypothetical protein